MVSVNKYHLVIRLASCLLIYCSCKESYMPPAVKNNPGFLVVDGLLTSAPDSTYITLTRTRNISDSSPAPAETHALVTIESESAGTEVLLEIRPGIYGSLLLPDSSKKYRLNIITASGEKYQSDFVPFKITPAIDSLNWTEDSSQVAIRVSSYDPSGNTQYYRWAYEEAWKYHTYYQTNFNYINDTPVVRGRSNLIYYCWSNSNSADIQVGSTSGLSQDLISNIVFHHVSKQTEKIFLEYSILAKQYALTKDQFEYWTNLKKTTEDLGTLFDAQPAQSGGNIHCISNPSETVLGWVGASSITRKRLFITRQDLSSYGYSPYFLPCQLSPELVQVINPNDKELARQYLETPNHLFTFLYEANGGYYIAPNFCADCREHGGTTTKPDFWR